MDIIAVDKVDNLLWLGRYSQRVYMTIREFFIRYDAMIEHPDFYLQYCENLQIPNCYTDLNDFVRRYISDKNDHNSIVTTLNRTYDNCIVLRNELGSETMSYLEVALNSLEDITDFDSFSIDLQTVLDYILAFWGSIDENIENYEIRNIIKLGKRLERLDMFLRLRRPYKDLHMAVQTLDHRLKKAKIPYNREAFMHARECIETKGPLDYIQTISYVESIL